MFVPLLRCFIYSFLFTRILIIMDSLILSRKCVRHLCVSIDTSTRICTYLLYVLVCWKNELLLNTTLNTQVLSSSHPRMAILSNCDVMKKNIIFVDGKLIIQIDHFMVLRAACTRSHSNMLTRKNINDKCL